MPTGTSSDSSGVPFESTSCATLVQSPTARTPVIPAPPSQLKMNSTCAPPIICVDVSVNLSAPTSAQAATVPFFITVQVASSLPTGMPASPENDASMSGAFEPPPHAASVIAISSTLITCVP